MEFDTKERYKFFGCARQHACAIGSGPRTGHSAFRRCTPHSSRNDLHRKRQLVSGEIPADEITTKEAAESLKRRGLHPKHLCTAINQLRHSIIRWPDRIYHGLFAFDVMHVLYINCIGYLQDILLSAMTPTTQAELDSRVQAFTSFRNPIDGTTTRKVTSLTRIGFMTAELRVIHLFIWSHALGSKATILAEEVREDALTAICSLQIICFSVRGKRPFTESEHRHIFEYHGRRFFRALDKLSTWKRRIRIQEAENYNLDKSPAKRRRVPYWKNIPKDDDESSDTASSSAPEEGSHFYERSDKIIPHSIVHFADQVMMGGTHSFHNTAAPEACHKTSVQLAGQRSRIYSDVNTTGKGMLTYMCDVSLMEHIAHVTVGTCKP